MRRRAKTPVPVEQPHSDGFTARQHQRLFLRILGYGMSRTTVEVLLAGRGLALAGILGPELFGVWALFRIGLRYGAFAGLGVLRGLEVKVARAGSQAQHTYTTRQALWGNIAAGHTFCLYGFLSLLAGVAWRWPAHQLVSMVFLGIAMGVLFERLWSYGITFLRAAGGLRAFAVLELSHAILQAVMCLLLALRWGLPGAFAGFAIAHLAGILLLAGRVPFRPWLAPRKVYRLIQIGFPVSLLGILTATLATVDRLLVSAFMGLGVLGVYTFAISISELGVSLALIIRTVILRDVYGPPHAAGEDGDHPSTLHRVLTGFAILGPPCAGLFAMLLPLCISTLIADYRPAIPVAQLLLFAGLVQGLINVAVLGIVAEGRQSRLPVLSIAAVCLHIALSLGALMYDLGLEGVAGAAFLTRLVYAAGVMILLVRVPHVSHLMATIGRLLVPSLWCALVIYTINRLATLEELKPLIFALLIYAVCLLALLPSMLRTLRLTWHYRNA